MKNLCDWRLMGFGLAILAASAALYHFAGLIWFWLIAVGLVFTVWGFVRRNDDEPID